MFGKGPQVDEGTIQANGKEYNVATQQITTHTGTSCRASATTKSGDGFYCDASDENAALKVLLIGFGGVLVLGLLVLVSL